MSKVGKAILIQTNLESIPTHIMQCFQVSKKTCQNQTTLIEIFFWMMSTLSQGMPMIAWDKVCKPKSQGGLGL